MSVKTKPNNKICTGLLSLIILFTCLLEIFPEQYLLFNLIVSGMLCVYWFINKLNKIQIFEVFLVLFVVLQFMATFSVDRISILVFFLFLETKELYSEKSIKTIIGIMVFFFVMVIMAYYIMGYNQSFDKMSWERIDNCFVLQKGLGFTNANRCMLYLYCISLLMLVFSKKIITYAFVLIVNYYIYIETQSRTFFYAILVTIVILLFFKILKIEEKTTFFSKVAIFSFFVLFILSIILPLYFSDTYLDDLFTGRLSANKKFLEYGLSLFGNSKLEEMTFDSSYLHMLLTKGILYLCMYLYIIFRKRKQFLTNKDSVLLVSLFCVSFMEVIFLKYMVMIVMGYILNKENCKNGN